MHPDEIPSIQPRRRLPSHSRARRLTPVCFAALMTCGFVIPLPAPGATPLQRGLDAGRSQVQAHLVSEWTSIRPGEPFWVGVHLEMQDGWHVNWQNPGDAGLAPTVTWRLPDGFTAGAIVWPFPERFDLPEVSIFGYAGDVLLMTRIDPPATLSEKEIVLRAVVDWLACAGKCVPGEVDVSLTLPVSGRSPAVDGRSATLFETARERVPLTSAPWRFTAKLTDDNITIDATPSDGTAESVPSPSAGDGKTGAGEQALGRLVFYPDSPGIIENSVEQKLVPTTSGYRLVIARARMALEAPDRIRGVLVSDRPWADRAGKALHIDIPLR